MNEKAPENVFQIRTSNRTKELRQDDRNVEFCRHAVCCIVLQCVAVCCSVLKFVAVPDTYQRTIARHLCQRSKYLCTRAPYLLQMTPVRRHAGLAICTPLPPLDTGWQRLVGFLARSLFENEPYFSKGSFAKVTEQFVGSLANSLLPQYVCMCTCVCVLCKRMHMTLGNI